MLRVLIPYTVFWVRLWYRLGHGAAHWCLRIVPMPALWRHQVAGAMALIPYLWVAGASPWRSTSPGAPRWSPG